MTEKKTVLPSWVSWLIYLAVTVLMTWPLINQLDSHLGGIDQDIFNVFWGNWWVRHVLQEGGHLYSTSYLTYPIGYDLVSFAFSPLLGVLSLPLAAIVSQKAGYNLLVMFVIILNSVAGERLVKYLTSNGQAALVAGFVTGFAPAVTAERLFHLNMAWVAWLALAALFLIRLMREAKIRDVLWLVLIATLAFLTRLQVGVLTALFCAVIFLSLALAEGRTWSPRAFRYLALALLLTLVVLSTLFVRVWRSLDQLGSENLYREARNTRSDLLSYITPSPAHSIFGKWTTDIYQTRFPDYISNYWTYIGIFPLALLVYATWKRTSEALPWLITFLIFFLLSLGSELQINGIFYKNVTLPYGLLESFFSQIAFDNPVRFNLAMPTALAVLVGLAVDQFMQRFYQPWLLLIPAALVLFEYAIVPMPQMQAPPLSPFHEHLAEERNAVFAIVDFPLTRPDGTVHRYYQAFHDKPIVGGWTHRSAPDTFSFIESNSLLRGWRGENTTEFRLFEALDQLAEANVNYILIHKDELGRFPLETELLTLAVRPYYEDDRLYVLPTHAKTDDALHIAHRFEGDLSLVQPLLTVETLPDGAELALYTCWRRDTPTGEIDMRVQVIDARQQTVAEQRTTLKGIEQTPKCQLWSLPLPLETSTSPFAITITAESEGHSLGAYTHTQAIQISAAEDGSPKAWLGERFPVTFDAPLELLGYNLRKSEGLMWLDLYWQSQTEHQAGYTLFVQMIDPVSQLPVFWVRDEVLSRLTWEQGSIVVEHRMIPLWNIPPGRYNLAFGLYPPGQPSQRIAAFKDESEQHWPGKQIVLDQPILVLPQFLKAKNISEKERVIVYTTGDAGDAPAHTVHAQFDQAAILTNYELTADRLVKGAQFEVTLYWRALDETVLAENYRVLVHVVGKDGALIGQHDGVPAKGQQPTSTWRTGDIIVDVHDIQWLQEDYTGTAHILTGLYNPETMKRLPAYDADGNRWQDDRVDIGQIEIQP